MNYVPIDTETFFPWPSGAEITASDRQRRKLNKAHPFAKDSRRNALRILTVHTGTEVLLFDVIHDVIPNDVRELLCTSTSVMHNADFDVTVLRRHGFKLSHHIFDTMLASKLLSLGKVNPERELKTNEEEDKNNNDDDLDLIGDDRPADNDLPAVVFRYLGVAMEKTKTKLGASDWSRIPLTEAQLAYAKADVGHLLDLVPVLTDTLKGSNLWDCFCERSEFFVHLNRIKFNGLPVNCDRLLHDAQKAEGLKFVYREQLKKMFADYSPPVPKSRRKKVRLVAASNGEARFKTEIQPEEFNPNAPHQIVAALALHGIEVPDSKKETLSPIDSPEAGLLLQYKVQASLLTTIRGIQKSVFPDHRVRAEGWNQLAARTGRIHSKSPNLQNLPRDWRWCFEAPDPHLWLKVDLSQIEIYILAIHTQDANLIRLLAQGKDVYLELAARIFNKRPIRGAGTDEVSEQLRRVAKVLTLGISYCLSVFGFIRSVRNETAIEYEQSQAEEFFNTFFDMFPAVKAYQDQCAELARTEECVYTVTGQRRFLPPLKDDANGFGYWPSLEVRKRVLANTPIQGSSANLLIRAVNKFMPKLPAGVQIVNLVHDEVDAVVTAATAELAKQIITAAFEESFAELFGHQLKVKLETKVRKTWGVPPGDAE
jgi:DNA polymerase I-like protein with 3'-5' exonuclease and polymerase domains